MSRAAFRHELAAAPVTLPANAVLLLDTKQALAPEVKSFCQETISAASMFRAFISAVILFLVFAGIDVGLVAWLLAKPSANPDIECIILALCFVAACVALGGLIKWGFLWITNRKAFWANNDWNRFGYFLTEQDLLVRRKRGECYFFPRAVVAGIRIQNRIPARSYGQPYVEVTLKTFEIIRFKEQLPTDLEPFKAFLASSLWATGEDRFFSAGTEASDVFRRINHSAVGIAREGGGVSASRP